MYEFACYFREWNVEQGGGLIYRMDYNQFWAWIEFNRLSTFLPQREDWRNAQLLSKLHNVNTTKEAHLTTPKDFMLKSIDETIEDEVRKEREEEARRMDAGTGIDIDTHTASVHNFKAYVSNLKANHKPHVETIKA